MHPIIPLDLINCDLMTSLFISYLWPEKFHFHLSVFATFMVTISNLLLWMESDFKIKLTRLQLVRYSTNRDIYKIVVIKSLLM